MKVDKILRDYRSFMACSCNSSGQLEIEIEYEPGVIGSFLALFGYPVETRATFVRTEGTCWKNKATGATVDSYEDRLLERAYLTSMNMKY
jgi:hypothetical protein